MKKRIIEIIICILFAFVSWYFMLPPLNVTSPIFWSYLFELLIVSTLVFIIGDTLDFRFGINLRKFKWLPIVIGSGFGIIVLILVINAMCSPFFNASIWARISSTVFW